MFPAHGRAYVEGPPPQSTAELKYGGGDSGDISRASYQALHPRAFCYVRQCIPFFSLSSFVLVAAKGVLVNKLIIIITVIVIIITAVCF